MKKLAIGLLAIGSALLATSGGAHADYPPGSTATLVVPAGPVAPGASATLTVNNCFPNEVIPFAVQGGPSGNATCSSTTFVASFAFTAPTAPGSYTVTAQLPAAPSGTTATNRPRTLTGTLVVQQVTTTTAAPTTTAPGGLPATGGAGTDNTMTLAIGALVVGAGLVAVSQVRRRQHKATST